MQLILTQSDIETALINYVNDLVNIKDGMSITVDLKATRGADGATAIIDISPANVGTAKAEPVVKQTTVSKPAASRSVEVKATDLTKDTKANNAKADPEVDPSPADEPNNYPPEDAADEANAAEAGEEQQPEVEEPPVKTKSLFEGLRKPKND